MGRGWLIGVMVHHLQRIVSLLNPLGLVSILSPFSHRVLTRSEWYVLRRCNGPSTHTSLQRRPMSSTSPSISSAQLFYSPSQAHRR